MRVQQPDFLRQQIALLLVTYPELAEDEQLRVDMIEAETDTLEIIGKLIRNIEDTKALVDGTDARIKEMTERKQRFGRRVDALRNVIRILMDAADLRKLELPTATLYFMNVPPKAIGDFDIRNNPKLPSEFVRTYREVDKVRITMALKAGERVEGFELSNAEPSLVIKVK